MNPATIEEPAVNQERSQADRRTQAGERSQVSGAPWRRCGSQIAHEGFQATSAPGQEGYAGPSARAAITATVLLELPAESYRLVPNILHHSASQRTYNSRICIAWPSLNTAGDCRGRRGRPAECPHANVSMRVICMRSRLWSRTRPVRRFVGADPRGTAAASAGAEEAGEQRSLAARL
eukprot:COSAG03_NODE_1233_length_4505_cov_2.830232_4_plen_178_part_00